VKILRRRLQPLSWIALVAVLALALLPTLSHALAFMQGERAPWSEVCGAQRVPRGVAGAESGAPLAVHAASEHCAWCGLSGSDLLPPSDAAPGLPVAGWREWLAAASAPAVDSRPAWAPALPRAPPASA
jgi:hypothetical protein